MTEGQGMSAWSYGINDDLSVRAVLHGSIVFERTLRFSSLRAKLRKEETSSSRVLVLRVP